MEIIGQLASGIAHDLNNILEPILASTALLRQKVQDKEGLELLDSLEANAKRVGDVVKQVLWFGRKLEGKRDPVNPGQLLKDVVRIISGTFSKSIEVETDIAADVHSVTAIDAIASSVAQSLRQRARRHANWRQIEVGVRNFTVDAQFANSNAEAKPGPYVLFEVTDTGNGIPLEIRDQIFEPFFTTKKEGQRQGFGVVHCTVHRQKTMVASLKRKSEVEKGSTFQVYLPVDQTQSHSDKVSEKKNQLTAANSCRSQHPGKNNQLG